ncbi:sigma-70 family RNA polymerase sigma factor [Fredinandcohnia sp. QZ13]|uniref:sigma-70 family RNA polymerase sigma factor n=1 Tax=Fredinandcohnia sp. QZ13 TaxID=3073144 RepID=UPI0028535AE7|nr:sigma-70 family RNA polymerase sigma factor [Fredinandcohnia sp. QZ13]MDR4888102.1 sigma-70 family RNA polymerase sigma factor [Fredinandcohnia sp. QZ13]
MSIFKSFYQSSNSSKYSFEALINKEQEKLYKVAYSYVKNEQDALDIVQDAIIKGFKSFDRLKEIEYFSTWITRILINTAIDHIRKSKKVITLETDLFDSGFNEENNSIITMDIELIFEKLRPQQKTLILLRFYYGYSINEISEILGKPEGTIKSQLHRTLQFIKEKLENGGDSYGKASSRY